MKDGLYHIKVTINFDETKAISEGFLIGDGGAVCIKLQPVKEVHAYWVPTIEPVWNLEVPVLVGWTCSECEHDGDQNFDFCPHCGARMDAEEIHG